ncbi:MAG: hypothetical protein WC417_07245 [Candidatus Omnitrophota bacterium]|jgi:hypothetical protein
MVNYTIHTPKDAKGGYFSVMFFETDLAKKDPDLNFSIDMKARLGALFSVEIKDSIVCSADVEKLAIKKEEGALKISAEFINKGNIDIAPRSAFHIIDGKGKVFCRGQFSDIFTLPLDKGEIYAEAKDKIEQGDYLLIITMNLGRGLPLVKEIPIQVNESGVTILSS